MPKLSFSSLPISALFAVNKPSGPTSMSIINDIKALVSSSRLFVPEDVLEAQKSQGKQKRRSKRNRDKGPNAVKIGQGGTLDPLADGVLVVGIGKGTKKLSDFLDCVKEYRTTCLLGCETDTYDSEGKQVRTAPWRHVTRELVEEALGQFRGEIQQAPPIFSALKMNGRPLYEYAREGIPLPRAIEKRPVTIHSLELTEWIGSVHGYKWPEKKFTEDEKTNLQKAVQGAVEAETSTAPRSDNSVKIEDDPRTEVPQSSEEAQDGVPSPTAFVLTMKVSGGTYVRSVVHDLGHAVGSAAHVVTLTRSRQGRFALTPEKRDMARLDDKLPVSTTGETAEEPKLLSGEVGTSEEDRSCVPWEVFAKAVEDPGDTDADGWYDWERQVMEKLEFVEGGRTAAPAAKTATTAAEVSST